MYIYICENIFSCWFQVPTCVCVCPLALDLCQHFEIHIVFGRLRQAAKRIMQTWHQQDFNMEFITYRKMRSFPLPLPFAFRFHCRFEISPKSFSFAIFQAQFAWYLRMVLRVGKGFKHTYGNCRKHKSSHRTTPNTKD